MARLIDPSEVLRAYRDPLSWVSLGVDLLPIIAVAVFGWGVTPLVALYWLENVVIGVFTLLRMIASGLASAASFAIAVLTVPFFTVHYGMFCFVHGVFLNAFASGPGTNADSPLDLVHWAVSTAPQMTWFIAAIAGVSLLYFAVDFIARGDFRTSNPQVEMFSPYGRIITLHIAILLGAAIAFSLNEPLAGVLLLIVIRVVFGIVLTILRRRKRDAQTSS